MTEEQLKKTTSTLMNVPMAIVIAGGLIAAAIYFVGGANDGSSTLGAPVANNNAAGQLAAPAGVPAQPTVGDIREVTAR